MIKRSADLLWSVKSLIFVGPQEIKNLKYFQPFYLNLSLKFKMICNKKSRCYNAFYRFSHDMEGFYFKFWIKHSLLFNFS
jgi:hypothetical protein